MPYSRNWHNNVNQLYFNLKINSFRKGGGEIHIQEFSGGLAVKGSGNVTSMALVKAVVRVQSLAQELMHATGTAKKKKIIIIIIIIKHRFTHGALVIPFFLQPHLWHTGSSRARG